MKKSKIFESVKFFENYKHFLAGDHYPIILKKIQNKYYFMVECPVEKKFYNVLDLKKIIPLKKNYIKEKKVVQKTKKQPEEEDFVFADIRHIITETIRTSPGIRHYNPRWDYPSNNEILTNEAQNSNTEPTPVPQDDSHNAITS